MHNGGLKLLFSFSKPVHALLFNDNLNAHYFLTMLWRVMYRGKNKFEVMYTREQVHYKEENIMEFVLIT